MIMPECIGSTYELRALLSSDPVVGNLQFWCDDFNTFRSMSSLSVGWYKEPVPYVNGVYVGTTTTSVQWSLIVKFLSEFNSKSWESYTALFDGLNELYKVASVLMFIRLPDPVACKLFRNLDRILQAACLRVRVKLTSATVCDVHNCENRQCRCCLVTGSITPSITQVLGREILSVIDHLRGWLYLRKIHQSVFHSDVRMCDFLG